MQLKDWTLVQDLKGKPIAAFHSRDVATDYARHGDTPFGLQFCTITLDLPALPAPPARDPNVIAREFADAYMRYEQNVNSAFDDGLEEKRNRLYAEYAAATAPKPPAEAKRRGLRVECAGPILFLNIPNRVGGFSSLAAASTADCEATKHSLIADLRAAGCPVEGAGGE